MSRLRFRITRGRSAVPNCLVVGDVTGVGSILLTYDTMSENARLQAPSVCERTICVGGEVVAAAAMACGAGRASADEWSRVEFTANTTPSVTSTAITGATHLLHSR